MHHLLWLFNFVLHVDVYLRGFVASYGPWVYLILFAVIFCETGLVVTPFLPGDSMIFMVGTLAASGFFGLLPSILILGSAAVLGDTVNYHIGKFVGPKAFAKENGRFFRRENLEKAQAFYRKWGGLAIILGRFMPIIRTFVPFTAGIGTMHYGRFLAFNAAGGLLWVSLFALAGFFFGNIPFVQKNLAFIIYGIVLVSILPAVFGAIASRRKAV